MYRITQVAESLGKSANTIRAWEEKGLITPHFDEKGRYYTAEQVKRMRHLVTRDAATLEKFLYDYPYLTDSEIDQYKKRAIDRSMKTLNLDEQTIIEMKFFNRKRPNDIRVMMDLNISNTSYYRVKKRALEKLTISLDIVIELLKKIKNAGGNGIE